MIARFPTRSEKRMASDEGVPAIPDILCLLLSSQASHSPLQTTHAVLCNPESRFFCPTPTDVKWACGYKNFQVLLSCLLRLPPAISDFLKGELKGHFGPTFERVPSVLELQKLIELAWESGFDRVHCICTKI